MNLIQSILTAARVHEFATGVKLDACECLPRTFAALRIEIAEWSRGRGMTEVLSVAHDEESFTIEGVRFHQAPSFVSFGQRWDSQVGFALYRRT